MKSKINNFGFFALTILFFLNILAWIVIFDFQKPRLLEVNFFDVGQGDAIFIETPEKHQILIDGGPETTILEKLATEMPFWDRSIDLIILTHPEQDHISGLIEVLKKYKIDFIFWTGMFRDTFEWKEWQKLIKSQKEKGAKVLIGQAGQKIIAGKTVIEIIYPWENLTGQVLQNSNNASIVAKLVFDQNSFLFTGDIYKDTEEKLIREYPCLNSCKFTILDHNPSATHQGINIDSDVLKVAHHGSKSSSSNKFIEKVSPKFAVIQAGKDNRYGHPHQETLKNLSKYDIIILRTDQDGDIKIISDGKNLKVK